MSICAMTIEGILLYLTQGHVPLFVNATAGTTVYGAFDPINEIADLCEKYNMWLHVDVSVTPITNPGARTNSAWANPGRSHRPRPVG